MPDRAPKHDLARLCKACYDGELELLGTMLDREDPVNGYQGDLNEHQGEYTPLHYAAVNGQLECVQALLKFGVDPHVRSRMPYGRSPTDGRTAGQIADDWGWEDIAKILREAEENLPKGKYIVGGPFNNAKIYPSTLTATGRDPAEVNRVLGQKLSSLQRPFFREEDEIRTSTAFLFPGRGSQYVGMLGRVKDLAAAKDMFDSAKQLLGWDPVDVGTNGPAAKLQQPEVSHPLLFIAGLAALEQLKQTSPESAARPGAVAGLDVGEFAALVAAGVLPFEDALRVVRLHGEAVAAASKQPAQATLSVAGMRCRKLEAICREVSDAGGQDAVCCLTNELFPKGATCGGTLESMQKLEKAVKEGGALQAKLISGGALHTPLMESAAATLREALKEVAQKMQPPKCDIYMNCTGKPVYAGSSPKALIPLLVRQLTEPVLWEHCVRRMIKAGVSEFHELGPRTQLKSMMKRIDAAAFQRTTSTEV